MELLKRLTYKNLKLNKKRTTVTIVGIILAVALLTALSTLVSSFRESIVEAEKKTGGNFHYEFMGVNEDSYAEFENNRSFESIYTLSQIGYATIEGCKNEYKPYAFICGTNEDGLENLSFNLIEGRMPENENEIVIPSHLKSNGRVEYEIGQTITLEVGKRVSDGEELDQSNPYNAGADEISTGDESDINEYAEEIIDTQTKTYTVVGIMNRPGTYVEPYTAPGYTFVTYMDEPQGQMNVFVRYTKKALRDRYRITAAILGIDEELYDKYMRENNSEGLTDLLTEADYGEKENYYLISYENLFLMDGSLKVIYVLAGIVAVIIMVTSVYCIKNSFDISTTEKTRQYGMLASIGATKKQIRKSVYFEGFLLGGVGIPGGILLGMLASFILIKVCNLLLSGMLNISLVFSVSIAAIAAAVLLGVVTIYLSSLGSARRAAKVSPIAAIRNQNDIGIKSKKIKAPKIINKIWGVGGVVSYKNLKRNKKKYRTTVISIIICTATFIVISYFMSMGFKLVKLAYGESDYDIYVYFYQNTNDIFGNKDIISQLTSLDNIEKYNATSSVSIYVENCEETKEFMEYKTGSDNYALQDDYKNNYFVVLCVSDNIYDEYIKELGLTDEECAGKAVLINNDRVDIYNEKSNSMNTQWINLYEYEQGDIIAGYINSGEEAGDTEYNLEIAAVTDERPLGYKNNYGNAFLVVNNDTWTELGFDATELYLSNSVYYLSSDAMTLQDDIDKTMEEFGASDADYHVNNREQDQKQIVAMFTLIAIFAYGLIAVIALIGITNIINTISTSMELRSREFATLRSVGMTSREFNRMIRLESLFTGTKALIIGVPAGWALSYLIYHMEITNDTFIEFDPPISATLACVLVVFLLLLAIMKFSLTKINKNNIIETIKDENI